MDSWRVPVPLTVITITAQTKTKSNKQTNFPKTPRIEMKRHFTWQIKTKVCRPDHLWHLQNFSTSSFMRSTTKVGVEAMYSFFTISLTLKK